MKTYSCDGCNTQDGVWWSVASLNIHLCSFCRNHYADSLDFRNDVKEWARIKRENKISRKATV